MTDYLGTECRGTPCSHSPEVPDDSTLAVCGIPHCATPEHRDAATDPRAIWIDAFYRRSLALKVEEASVVNPFN